MNEQHRFHPLFETSVGALCGLLAGVLILWLTDSAYGDMWMLTAILGATGFIPVSVRTLVFRHRFSWHIIEQTLTAWVGGFVGIIILVYIWLLLTPFIFDREGLVHFHYGTPLFWSARGQGGGSLIMLMISAVLGIVLSRWFDRHRPGGMKWRLLAWDAGVALLLVGTTAMFLVFYHVSPTKVFPPPGGTIYVLGTDPMVDAAIASMQQRVSDQRRMANQTFFRVPVSGNSFQQFQTVLAIKQFYEDQEYGWVGSVDSIGNGLILHDTENLVRVVISCTPISERGELLVTYGTR